MTTQFVHYPREEHGLREPNHKLDEVHRSLTWINKYVRDGGQSPATFRPGDRVPSTGGTLELRVTKTEIAAFVGQPKLPEGETAPGLLEVAFTLHSPHTASRPTALTLRLDEIALELQEIADPTEAPSTESTESGEKGQEGATSTGSAANSANRVPQPKQAAGDVLRPVGIPFEAPGGKLLIEGEALRLTQYPDPETEQFAFGLTVVFRVSGAGSGLLRVHDFPPVALTWDAPDEP